MHGGLPMVDGVVLDDIKKLSRECEPGEQGEISGFLFRDTYRTSKTNKL